MSRLEPTNEASAMQKEISAIADQGGGRATKVEQLIQQYCPDGVEWRKLKDVADFQYGYPFAAELFTDDDSFCPLIRIRDVKPGTTKTFYKGEVLPEYLIRKGDILVGMDGEFNLARWQSADALLNQRVCKIKANSQNIVLDGFLYHYLLPLFKQIEASIQGSTVKHLSAQKLNTITIPVPPLPVQEEIVRILDTLTELQAELQAELQKRLQQYNYYRDKLLLNFTPEQNAKECYLEEITTDIYSGATPSTEKREFWENGTIPWMSSGEVNLGKVYDVEGRITQLGYDKCSTKMVPQGSVVIALAGQGKTRGTVALLKTTVCTNQSLAALVPNTKMVSGEYLYHYLRTQYLKLREVSAGDGTRGGLNLKMLRSYKVIIPPMEEQQRIVDILDRFDTLTTDITAGLPAEIEARRKQYEYYRDKLLTFKKK